jgi:hypothetical protein
VSRAGDGSGSPLGAATQDRLRYGGRVDAIFASLDPGLQLVQPQLIFVSHRVRLSLTTTSAARARYWIGSRP